MTGDKRAGRVRLTVSVPRAIAEQLKTAAAAHERSVACEGGLLIRLGLEARSQASKPSTAAEFGQEGTAPGG